MAELQQLQETLRSIEQGGRMAEVDALLIRQVLHQPMRGTAPLKPSLGATSASVSPVRRPDVTRELFAIRKARQREKQQQQLTVSANQQPVPVQPEPTAIKNHDTHKREQRELDQAVVLREAQLVRTQQQVHVAEKAVETLMSEAQKLLPATFLFERNLTDLYKERSLQAVHHVLHRFQHRFFELYFARWRQNTLALRQAEHMRAASTIQRVHRGHAARRLVQRLRRQLAELRAQAQRLLVLRMQYRQAQVSKIQMVWRRFLYNRCVLERLQRANAAVFLQRGYRASRLQRNQLIMAIVQLKLIRAAIQIQRVVRGHRARERVHRLVRSRKREAIVAEIVIRNSSHAARVAWTLERRGAAFIIGCALYPYVVHRRFKRLIELSRRQRAARVIARRVVQWYREVASPSRNRRRRKQNKGLSWLDMLAKEQTRSNQAAVRIQALVRAWTQRRAYQMQIRRAKKLARNQRLQAKTAAALERTRRAQKKINFPFPVVGIVSSPKNRVPMVNVWKHVRSSSSQKSQSLLQRDSTQKIQRCYRAHCRLVSSRLRHWRALAVVVEERFKQRRQAAITIQRRLRGIHGRVIARRERAFLKLRLFIQRWKWRRTMGRADAAARIMRWWRCLQSRHLASVWREHKKRQRSMAIRIQKWLRRTLFYRTRTAQTLAQARRQQETRIACEQYLVICRQHALDKQIMRSISSGSFESLLAAFLHPKAKQQRSRRQQIFPILQLVFIVVSGLKDRAQWVNMDEKTLYQTKMERSKAVALFKAASKLFTSTHSASKDKKGNPNGSPKAKRKTPAFVTPNDIDVALAKAGGASKRAITFSEFVHLLLLIAEQQMGPHVSIWWSKYVDSEAQLLALLWDVLFPLAELHPIVREFTEFVNERMTRDCQCIQRLARRRQDRLDGLLMKANLFQAARMVARHRAAVLIQQLARSLLAKRTMRRRMQQVYEKYVDPTWGLPYWLNPRTGFSTWQKPRELSQEDVCVEAVPFPPPELTIRIACQGKPVCPICAEWFCVDCDEFFCRDCLRSVHKEPQQRSSVIESADPDAVEISKPHKKEHISRCGLCRFQIASRKCLQCVLPARPRRTDYVGAVGACGGTKAALLPSKGSTSDVFDAETVENEDKQQREALFCDVCFAFQHRRGTLQAHKSTALLEMCSECQPEDDGEAPISPLPSWPRAVQFECQTCPDHARVCGRCALSRHPVEACGELMVIPFETLDMKARAKRLQEEAEARDRADVEKCRLRALQAKQEHCAQQIQRFWRDRAPILNARRLRKDREKAKRAFWEQRQRDLRIQHQISYRLRDVIGRAAPLPTDSVAMQQMRRMNALLRRNLELRARHFGLLVHEYMLVGIPLPGIGRLRSSSEDNCYLETTEDLRGWIANHQTLRLRWCWSTEEQHRRQQQRPFDKQFLAWEQMLRSKSREAISIEQTDDDKDGDLVNVIKPLEEHRISIASEDATRLLNLKTHGAGDAEREFVLYLVEFSTDPKRRVWINRMLYVSIVTCAGGVYRRCVVDAVDDHASRRISQCLKNTRRLASRLGHQFRQFLRQIILWLNPTTVVFSRPPIQRHRTFLQHQSGLETTLPRTQRLWWTVTVTSTATLRAGRQIHPTLSPSRASMAKRRATIPPAMQRRATAMTELKATMPVAMTTAMGRKTMMATAMRLQLRATMQVGMVMGLTLRVTIPIPTDTTHRRTMLLQMRILQQLPPLLDGTNTTETTTTRILRLALLLHGMATATRRRPTSRQMERTGVSLKPMATASKMATAQKSTLWQQRRLSGRKYSIRSLARSTTSTA